jgi:hypothetical protein
VPSLSSLDGWAERLAAAGGVHSAVAPANSFRRGGARLPRPDNIQLELFYDPNWDADQRAPEM